MAWQATTVAMISLLAGLPLGILAGRWGWNYLAERLGVVPEPVVPLAVLLVIPAAVVLANLIAFPAGWIASRLRAAVVLRSE